jgi:hypothetical protein
MAVLVSPVGDFPLNDDWVYARAVQSILETGRFQLAGWSQASAFSQAYWGALFCWPSGFSFTALRFSSLALGLGGVLATYALLRQLQASPPTAMIGASAVAVNPLYLGLSNTFMTDVPFYCFTVVSVLLLVRGLQRDDAACLILGILAAYAATLTRQIGLMLPLAFGFAYLARPRRTLRTVLLSVAPLLLGLLLHLLLHRWLVAGGRTPELSSEFLWRTAWRDFVPRLTRNGFSTLIYMGLFVLPCAWAARRAARGPRAAPDGRRGRTRLLGLLLVVAAALAYNGRWMPFSENVLIDSGLGPLTLRDTFLLGANNPPAWPPLGLMWKAATAAAALGAALLLLQAWHRGAAALRRGRAAGPKGASGVAIFLGVGGVGFLLLITAAGPTFFDRYMLLCMPFALALFTGSSRDALAAGASRFANHGRAAGAWLLVAYGAFSVVATHDYLAWNRARWVALSDLTERDGISPATIDGGYEFNGWYLYDPAYRDDPPKSWWWVKGDDYVVASGGLPGYRETASYPYDRWLPPGPARVVVLKKAGEEGGG